MIFRITIRNVAMAIFDMDIYFDRIVIIPFTAKLDNDIVTVMWLVEFDSTNHCLRIFVFSLAIDNNYL